MPKLLEAKDLRTHFATEGGVVRAVDGVSYRISEQETLGLVGESGCGKTTVGRCVIRLYRPTGGRIVFDGKDVTCAAEQHLREVRSHMALIFQDPYSSLDPRQNAGNIVGEPLRVHNLTHSTSEYSDRVDRLFGIVGLDPAMKDRFPHQFSGGQRQRIGIARALACEPSLIICDEPISALDVSIQARIINLLQELQEEFHGLSYLFIAHDLSVVRHISDRVAVMYPGHVVEITTRRRSTRALSTHTRGPFCRRCPSRTPWWRKRGNGSFQKERCRVPSTRRPAAPFTHGVSGPSPNAAWPCRPSWMWVKATGSPA